MVVDGESVAAGVDDVAAEPVATVATVAGAAPNLATESPNLLSLKPGNCSLAADMVNADDAEEAEEPNLGGLSTGFLSTAVAEEEEALPLPPLPASDMMQMQRNGISRNAGYVIGISCRIATTTRLDPVFCCKV